MPTGIWQMTFKNGLIGGGGGYTQDCVSGESGLYQVYVNAGTFNTSAYSFQNYGQQSPTNQLFYGLFNSQLGGTSDSCFSGIIGSESSTTPSAIPFCQSPQIQAGDTIKFYGCNITEINFVYYFNASYQISGHGVNINGIINGYSGNKI